MWMDLFMSLLLAHLVADFVLQARNGCKDKVERKWRSLYHYWHAAIVFVISWLVSWDVRFWWCALLIGITHFAIDMWKSYREENVVWFSVDQILHILILVGVSVLWCGVHDWSIPFGLAPKTIAIAVAALVCWKPANIFIKLMQHYEALGLLVAAKSIIRFGDAQTRKSEYVLAGTLLSIFIAVVAGLMVGVLL